MCVDKDGVTFAPGYCRFCRSYKWRRKQDTVDLSQLYQKILDERALKFDMLVIFDETIHTIDDLDRTLESTWYQQCVQKIIIVDVTGFGNRENLALQYIKKRINIIPIVIDSSVIHESIDQRNDTLRRLSKQIIAPFFMVIPAGRKIDNFDYFATMIKYMPIRVIHWSFPFTVGETTIMPNQLHYGLFITAPYRAIMKSPETESFTQQLRKEEIETEMGLSWFCENHPFYTSSNIGWYNAR
jgi:hypothetical protein